MPQARLFRLDPSDVRGAQDRARSVSRVYSASPRPGSQASARGHVAPCTDAMAIGLFLTSTNLVLVGAVLSSAVLLFQVVTLPVEFNASNRAKALIVEHGIIAVQER